MPSLFRRKSDDSENLVTNAVTEANTRAAKSGRPAATKATAASAGTKRTPASKVAPGGGKATPATAKAGPAKKTTAVVKKAAPVKATKLASTKVTVTEDDEADDAKRPRGYTASKKDLGQATPKRKAGGRLVEAPPANRREAMKRVRAKERASRAEARAGALAGKDEYLPKRDQGPERALVRDIVDARHSISRGFMPIALLLIFVTSAAMPTPIRLGGNLLFYGLILGVIVDCFLLTRRIRKLVLERFPKSTLPPRSYYFYGIMRALAFRKIRMPAPRVKVGAKV